MNPATIIKKPLISEKSSFEIEKRNAYSFVVDRLADKDQIKEAIAKLYKVRVVSVKTQLRKGTRFRTRHGHYSSSGDWKKAVVQVHADDRIEFF